MTMAATGAQTNTVLALAALLIIGVSNAAVWAATRIRARRAQYASYRRGHDAGYVAGHTTGYRKAYAEQDLLVDELRDEIEHLEQRNAELSKQMGAAA
jgi:hypothetical protein